MRQLLQQHSAILRFYTYFENQATLCFVNIEASHKLSTCLWEAALINYDRWVFSESV